MADFAQGRENIWLVEIEILDDLDMKRVGPIRAKAAAAVNFVSHVSFKSNADILFVFIFFLEI